MAEDGAELPPSPNQDSCAASCAARDACWKTVGQVDSDVLSHLINPAFMGGPRWPALRQAFAVVRRPETQTVVLASDGLSDPWDGEANPTVPYFIMLVKRAGRTEARLNNVHTALGIPTPAAH